MVQVAPSLLSADFARLGAEVRALDKAGADLIHIDVMDGCFVPNLTFGSVVVKDIRSYTDKPFDVHLMVEKPSALISSFCEAGADSITVHVECGEKIEDLISQVKKYHKKVGLSIKPQTKVATLIPFLPLIDSILVMSVEPGFGGQQFIFESLKKITELKELIGRKKILIEVDGGINDVTAPACVFAGADILVAGSYVFNSSSYKKAINRLKGG